jgi:hypothetical protein
LVTSIFKWIWLILILQKNLREIYMLEHYIIQRLLCSVQEQGVSIEDHPTFTQLLVRLVIVVGELGDPDTIFYLLDSLKCLALNEEGLLETSR